MRTFHALFVVVALGGCATSAGSNCPGSTQTTPTVETDHNPIGLGIRLLEPGAEPRSAIRYKLKEGLIERSRIELVIGASVEGNGGVAEAMMPPLALELEAGPVKSIEGGLYSYPIRISKAVLADPNVDPELAKQMEDELRVLLQVRGTVEVDDRGVLRGRSFAPPPNVPADLLSLLGNIRNSLMSIPLPEEPVGPGARWEVTREIDSGGLMVEQTLVYSLQSVDARGGLLEVVVRQTAPPQEMGGTRLHAYEGTGVGSANFLFNRLTPLSEIDATNQTRFTSMSNGVPTSAQMRRRTVLRLYNLDRSESGALKPPAPAEPAAPATEGAVAPSGAAAASSL